MRQRTARCVVSFRTTAGAMAAERLCRREGLEGHARSALSRAEDRYAQRGRPD